MNSKWALKELNFAENKKKKIILVDLDHSPMTDAFMFDYKDKDNIVWDNKIQHDKLIKNLRKWIGNTLPQKEKNNGENAKENSLEKEKVVRPKANILTLVSLIEQAKELSIQKKYKEAFAIYLEAANYEDPEAQTAVAEFYYYGKGVKSDLRKALVWYESAATKGDSQAKARLEKIREKLSEQSVVVNNDNQNSLHDIDNLGLEKAKLLFYREEYEKAFEEYISEAKWGDPEAQTTVAGFYYYGIVKNRDLREALKWYVRAASKGNSIAKARLEEIREKLSEQSVEVNNDDQSPNIITVQSVTQKAKTLYSKREYKEAYTFYMEAAILGDPEAQAAVAEYYYYGRGMYSDLREALMWYESAARKGDSKAKARIEEIRKKVIIDNV